MVHERLCGAVSTGATTEYSEGFLHLLKLRDNYLGNNMAQDWFQNLNRSVITFICIHLVMQLHMALILTDCLR